MLTRTSLVRPWRLFFPSRRGGDMHRMLEVHFWGLTHYRILPRFLGLDAAGNVLFFPAYRKRGFGGWTAATLGAPGGFLSADTTSANVLEDGYPMHHKASRKLQEFLAQERRRWKEAEDALAEKSTDSANPTTTSNALPDEERVEIRGNYDSEQKFRDLMTVKLSNPRFYNRVLRINPFVTFAYKAFYFYAWAVVISLVVQGYLMFRAWVNPPAREGLKNLEAHVFHLPRLIFAGCVSGIAWVVRGAQPVIDPVVEFLARWFPRVDWNAASAERLATRAETLASDAHPGSTLRRAQERERERLAEQQRRVWWTRVLVVLLMIFSVLCVL
ncbi:unnamed protein product [Phytomonas sp. EM1]|nr:unnamed protein product [Phytomonas sp. EM1]|eukprot:CCW65142.1 unnamed protein product [Phytomonas sp. isolate EM1]